MTVPAHYVHTPAHMHCAMHTPAHAYQRWAVSGRAPDLTPVSSEGPANRVVFSLYSPGFAFLEVSGFATSGTYPLSSCHGVITSLH